MGHLEASLVEIDLLPRITLRGWFRQEPPAVVNNGLDDLPRYSGLLLLFGGLVLVKAGSNSLPEIDISRVVAAPSQQNIIGTDMEIGNWASHDGPVSILLAACCNKRLARDCRGHILIVARCKERLARGDRG